MLEHIDRKYIFRGFILFTILGLSAGCTRSLLVTPPVSTPLAPTNTPVFTNTDTPAATSTPTGSYTATPTNTYTATNTFTVTNTPTFTPTTPPTPVPTITFEDWEGPYASGNMWAGFAVCGAASYICNPWTSNASITTCYDNNPGDPRSGSYTWKSQITWTADAGQAQIAPDSAYGGDYGYPINIASSAPSSVSVWLKSDTANTQFAFYIQDTSSLASGSPLHTAYYQNGTGANYLLTIPTANVWTHFVLPLAQGGGTGNWSFDPASMNWGSILDIGTVFQGPTGASYPLDLNIYMDDYGFVP